MVDYFAKKDSVKAEE